MNQRTKEQIHDAVSRCDLGVFDCDGVLYYPPCGNAWDSIPYNPAVPSAFGSLAIPHALLSDGTRAWVKGVLIATKLEPFFPKKRRYCREDSNYIRKDEDVYPFLNVMKRENVLPGQCFWVEDRVENLILLKDEYPDTTTILLTWGRPIKPHSAVDFMADTLLDFLEASFSPSLPETACRRSGFAPFP